MSGPGNLKWQWMSGQEAMVHMSDADNWASQDDHGFFRHGNEINSTCRQYVIQADLATIVAYLCQIRNILLYSFTVLENFARILHTPSQTLHILYYATILAYSVTTIAYTVLRYNFGILRHASPLWQVRLRTPGLSFNFKILAYYAKVFAYYVHISDISDSIVLILANFGENFEFFASVVVYNLIIFT